MSAPEIPLDIWMAAEASFAKTVQSKDLEDEIGIIALAILAERERCAQITEAMDRDGRSNWGAFTARAIRTQIHPHSSQIAVSSADHAQTEPTARSGEKSAATNPEGDA